MNYSELVTQVNDYCENSFPTVNMDVFIRQAEQRIYNTAQPANLRKNVTGVLTVGNKYLQCPSDFLSVYSLAVYPYNTTTATGTSGQKTIVVASTTGIEVGQQVTGTGIGTCIGCANTHTVFLAWCFFKLYWSLNGLPHFSQQNGIFYFNILLIL